MLVETKPRSESASETQLNVARRISLIESGAWTRNYLIGFSEHDLGSNRINDEIEHRVASSAKALFAGTPDFLSPSITRYHVEQEFEGVVLDVDRDARQFYVRLVDETNPDNPDEEALMSFDEISPDDFSLITPGALFSWVMGRTERNGSVARHSEIRFRRLVKFSKQAIQCAETEASDLYFLLDEA